MRAARRAARSSGGLASDLLSKRSLTSTGALVAYLGAAGFVFHMAFAGSYGYFRDELYYIVSGTQHLSLGYVDFPPMIAWIAALLYPLTGDSLVSIHVVPALTEALVVFTSGMIARELGGGRRAQLLAAASTLLSLGFLAEGSLFGTDALDQLWWALLAYVVVRLVRRDEPKLWVAAGLVLGVGLLSKLTIFFFAGALLVSFLLVPSARKHLRSRWLPVGALLAALCVLPMVYWNAANGWPMVDFYFSFTGDFNAGPLGFVLGQVGLMSYLGVPMFLLGLYTFLRSDRSGPAGAIGVAYVLLFGLMTALGMKPYYLLGIYPALLAGGALAVERSADSRSGRSRWLGSKPYLGCLLAVVLLLSPLVMPILSPASLVSVYGESTLQSANGTGASGESGPLPQFFGDRFGWDAMVSNITQVYDSLPPGLRSQACIFASNYGEASALNFLGRGLGLPPAISGHNSYFIWGPGACTGQVLITVGEPLSSDQKAYANATIVTTISCKYCMDLENGVPVVLCTHPTFTSLATEWSTVKQYD